MEPVNWSHSQYPVHEIPNEHRKQLALKIIRDEKPVSQLADEQKVSRNFLYKQKSKAISAIDQAFEQKGKESKVLFYIPVTQDWLRQVLEIFIILFCGTYVKKLKKLKSFVHGGFDFNIYLKNGNLRKIQKMVCSNFF